MAEPKELTLTGDELKRYRMWRRVVHRLEVANKQWRRKYDETVNSLSETERDAMRARQKVNDERTALVVAQESRDNLARELRTYADAYLAAGRAARVLECAREACDAALTIDSDDESEWRIKLERASRKLSECETDLKRLQVPLGGGREQ